MEKLSQATLTQDIEILIAEIYTAFSNYPISEIKGVCTGCCMYPSNVEKILNQPLNTLEQSTIYDYLDAAKYEIDAQVKEAKYLLPRIIELFNAGENIRSSPELTFETCYFNHSECWTEDERQLIRRFAALHFKKVIIEENKDYSLDELIIMWDYAGLETGFLFDIWQQLLDYPKAINDYASMLWFHFSDLNYNQVFASEKTARELTNWALSQEIITNCLQKVELALTDIDSLSDWQLDSYEYILQLK